MWNPQELLEQLDNDRAFLCELPLVYRRQPNWTARRQRRACEKRSGCGGTSRAHPEKHDPESSDERCRPTSERSKKTAARRGKSDHCAVLLS
jgi:hypothetical protein